MAKKEKNRSWEEELRILAKASLFVSPLSKDCVHQRGSGHHHAVEQLLGNIPGTYGSPTGGEGRDGWDRPRSCEPEQLGCTEQLTLG